MTYLVVCGWDDNGKSPAYRIEETEELAQAAVARILPENSEVFYCEAPAGDPAYFVVNADAQTVAEDSATRSADDLAAKWSGIRAERDALLAACDWMAHFEIVLPPGFCISISDVKGLVTPAPIWYVPGAAI